jgi:hypothetical protein
VPAVGELAEISVEAGSLLLEIPAKKKKAYSNIIQIFLSAGADEFTTKSYQRTCRFSLNIKRILSTSVPDRIRIHRIHMYLGLPDPDPFVRGMDPDPSVIMQK